MFVIFLGIVCLAGAAYLLGEAATAPARERHTSVRRAATYGKFRSALGEREQPFHERVLVGSVVGGAVSGPGGFLLFALAFGGIGFLLPDFVVSAKARSRKEAIKAQLPDALDLLAVSVEAGLG